MRSATIIRNSRTLRSVRTGPSIPAVRSEHDVSELRELAERRTTVDGAVQIMRLAIGSIASFLLCVLVGLTVLAAAPRLFGYGAAVVGSGSCLLYTSPSPRDS